MACSHPYPFHVYRAVHADRSGRILVTDHPALAFDGARYVPFADALPLPADTLVVPIDREAFAAERSGRPRPLGAGRLAAAALLPPGHLRTLLPAYADDTGSHDLAPQPYAAVAANDDGKLLVAALELDVDPTHDAAAFARSAVAERVADGLRARPGDRIVRQLARCAREYGCHGAANAFFGRWECALPIAAPANERPPAPILPKRDGEAAPTEEAAFHPTADEVARLGAAHVAAGGSILAFGRACEGEPLLSAREVEESITRMRAMTRGGTIHLETNGSAPGALRRLAAAGLESIGIRMLAFRAASYETLHGPLAYRFADVRATLRLAAELRLAISIDARVLPGIFDRADELDALVALLADAPEGTALSLRDLHADPLRALALLPADEPVGVTRAVPRLREELPHVRIGAFVRPLAKAPHVP